MPVTKITNSDRAVETSWSPDQYLKFSDHRLRPALELLDRVSVANPQHIYDLGCGVGNVTQVIQARWPSARVTGVDSSQEMLDKAAREQGATNVTWLEADIKDWQPTAAADLIFSNAALHWLADHQNLLPNLANLLSKGGCLAIQMPLSWDASSHRLMRETLASPAIPGAVATELKSALAHNRVHEASYYYDLLSGCSAHLDIWQTEYLQLLSGADPVFEWVKATGLRPVLTGLDERQRNVFVDRYKKSLRDAYPVRADGKTLYPFRRLFIVASR